MTTIDTTNSTFTSVEEIRNAIVDGRKVVYVGSISAVVGCAVSSVLPSGSGRVNANLLVDGERVGVRNAGVESFTIALPVDPRWEELLLG